MLERNVPTVVCFLCFDFLFMNYLCIGFDGELWRETASLNTKNQRDGQGNGYSCRYPEQP